MTARRVRPPVVLLPLLAALVLVTPAARGADILVLEGGRRLEVDRWWVEEDQIIYEKYGGTIGIAKESVVAVLDGEDGSDRRAQPARNARGYTAPAIGSGLPTASPAEEIPTIVPDLPGEMGTDSLDRQLRSLEELAQRDPSRRREAEKRMALVLTLMGNEALQGGNPEGAIVTYRRAAALDVDLSATHVNLAAALLTLGRNGEALAEAEHALALAPDQPDALFLKGEALYRDERMEEAIRLWRRAQEISPSPRLEARLEKALREQEVGGGYRSSAGAHFTLRYDGARADDALGGEILRFLEERFLAMVGRYNHLPEAVIVVILYPTAEFHDVTGTPRWTGGLFDGKIRVPLGGSRRLDDRLRRVLVHELTHSFVYWKTRGNCPTWLQEGLAQYEEGRRAGDGTLRDLAGAYRASTPESWGRELDYPSSLALTEFLIDRFRFTAVLQLLDRLGAGDEEGRALERSLGLGADALLRQWGEHLAARRGA